MADQIVGVDWRSIAYAVRQENIKLKSQLEVVVKERDKYKALVDIQNQTKEERKAERLKKQQEKQVRKYLREDFIIRNNRGSYSLHRIIVF